MSKPNYPEPYTTHINVIDLLEQEISILRNTVQATSNETKDRDDLIERLYTVVRNKTDLVNQALDKIHNVTQQLELVTERMERAEALALNLKHRLYGYEND